MYALLEYVFLPLTSVAFVASVIWALKPRSPGRHRAIAELKEATGWLQTLGEPEYLSAPTAPQYYPPVYEETHWEPSEQPPDNEYLEKADALILATRARFAAIHEFVDAWFDAQPALEAA